MVEATSRTFEIIAVRRGEELTRITVVATDADAALGRWMLAEKAKMNLFDRDQLLGRSTFVDFCALTLEACDEVV